jgi:hypothetical protein
METGQPRFSRCYARSFTFCVAHPSGSICGSYNKPHGDNRIAEIASPPATLPQHCGQVRHRTLAPFGGITRIRFKGSRSPAVAVLDSQPWRLPRTGEQSTVTRDE